MLMHMLVVGLCLCLCEWPSASLWVYLCACALSLLCLSVLMAEIVSAASPLYDLSAVPAAVLVSEMRACFRGCELGSACG